MSVIRVERHARLRLGGEDGTFALATVLPNGERPVIRRKPGVLVFEDIPVGAQVHARVDRPTELNEASDGLPSPTEVVAAGPPTLTWAAGPPSTVTRSAGSFIADGYAPGMRLVVTSPLNAGVYTIADVTAAVITLVPSEAFVAEGPLSGGETLNGGVNVQPYLFERAPLPAAFTVGGVQFRSRTRVLNVVGGDSIEETQHVPTYAAFAPAQAGSLAQKGRATHLLPMPGGVAEANRELLRMRWAGMAVAGATLFTAVGGETVVESNAAAPPLWPNGHENLVPGSIVVTLTGGAGVLRDDGAGRLVGAGGDGQVDYQTGAWHVDLNAAAVAGNVTVNYEHGCSYRPLDVFLEWDSLLR